VDSNSDYISKELKGVRIGTHHIFKIESSYLKVRLPEHGIEFKSEEFILLTTLTSICKLFFFSYIFSYSKKWLCLTLN
jgi:hypothetical protein